MARSNSSNAPRPPQSPPATTLEGRENQLISLAVDLAERQMIDGTASAQVITHYLKLGSTAAQLEKRKVELEIELAKKKVSVVDSSERIEELYGKALNAMRGYQGEDPIEEGYDYED